MGAAQVPPFGAVGPRNADKAISNSLDAVNLAAIAEAVVIGRASGLDPA